MPDKVTLKKRRLVNRPSRICKVYITNVGFVEKLKPDLSYLDKLKKKKIFYQPKYHFDLTLIL